MRACALIPAFDAAKSVADVVRETRSLWPEPNAVYVIDDGSRDDTARLAREAGAIVLSHPTNRGKGAALRSGMARALADGFDVAVSIDADGQHPPAEAVRLLAVDPDPDVFLLGVRDLEGAGAPKANRISNGISNFFLSVFARRRLADTQCGLRRYPLAKTLGLDGHDDGYAFEAEVILRAIAAKIRLVEVPVRVFYPDPKDRVTHFDSVRDPARIIVRVVKTLVATGGVRHLRAVPVRVPVRANDREDAEGAPRASDRAATSP